MSLGFYFGVKGRAFLGAEPEALLTAINAALGRAGLASYDEPSGDPRTTYLRLRDGRSDKFYEVTISGASYRIRFGRVGSDGQTKTVKASSAEAARREADAKIGEKLAKGYERTAWQPWFGKNRCATDQHSAGVFTQLKDIAKRKKVAGVDLCDVYVPVDFPQPLVASVTNGRKRVKIAFGSVQALASGLKALAPHLGIPLERGKVSDATVRKINDFRSLTKSDVEDGEMTEEAMAMAEGERLGWLLMFETCRLAAEHAIAFVVG